MTYYWLLCGFCTPTRYSRFYPMAWLLLWWDRVVRKHRPYGISVDTVKP